MDQGKVQDQLPHCVGSNCPIAVKDKLTHHGAPRPYIRIESGATGIQISPTHTSDT